MLFKDNQFIWIPGSGINNTPGHDWDHIQGIEGGSEIPDTPGR